MELSGKRNFTAALVYLAVSLLFFLPCLGHFSDQIIGPPEDNMFILWTLWYGTESLLHHSFPLMYTHHLYYPGGIGLFFCNYYYYGLFLALFLRGFFTLPFIYNLLVVHTFVLAGLGAFWLVHYLTKDFKASLLGGFVFAFNPSHFAHSLHHLTIASIQFIPFFVLFFIKTIRGEKRSNIGWASLFMILDALCDWNYLVFDLLFIFLSVVYFFLWQKKDAIDILKRIFWIPVIVFFVLSPLIIPMIWISLRHAFVRDLSFYDACVADIFGFFIPHVYHWAASWGFIPSWNEAMTGTDWEKAVYLGIVNLSLVLFMARRIWKECWKYFLGLLAFMILAMGDAVHFLGRTIPIRLPFRLIHHVPLLSNARCPSRIIVYAYLFLAILVAFSVKRLWEGIQSKRMARIVLGIVFLAVFFDFYSANASMTPVVLPPCYAIIQKDTDKNFGILELPWDGARYMMYQTIHGIPCVQGYMGRRVERTLDDDLVYDLRHLDIQKKMLTDNHVKYIVLHKRRLPKDIKKDKALNYWIFLNKASAIYSKTYDKIYEDDSAATFKVY